ncbi:hypothetical protein SUZIE_156730 [Sciurus carolinensis]|uniref:Uncharacterized protein n=1 Tax=Sciurus carolinensis TaxID=30640 RepID=A0AA41MY43_SCICA|nr:hypothetical protein [Sciurus carolinensis]
MLTRNLRTCPGPLLLGLQAPSCAEAVVRSSRPGSGPWEPSGIQQRPSSPAGTAGSCRRRSRRRHCFGSSAAESRTNSPAAAAAAAASALTSPRTLRARPRAVAAALRARSVPAPGASKLRRGSSGGEESAGGWRAAWSNLADRERGPGRSNEGDLRPRAGIPQTEGRPTDRRLRLGKDLKVETDVQHLKEGIDDRSSEGGRAQRSRRLMDGAEKRLLSAGGRLSGSRALKSAVPGSEGES